MHQKPKQTSIDKAPPVYLKLPNHLTLKTAKMVAAALSENKPLTDLTKSVAQNSVNHTKPQIQPKLTQVNHTTVSTPKSKSQRVSKAVNINLNNIKDKLLSSQNPSPVIHSTPHSAPMTQQIDIDSPKSTSASKITSANPITSNHNSEHPISNNYQLTQALQTLLFADPRQQMTQTQQQNMIAGVGIPYTNYLQTSPSFFNPQSPAVVMNNKSPFYYMQPPLPWWQPYGGDGRNYGRSLIENIPLQGPQSSVGVVTNPVVSTSGSSESSSPLVSSDGSPVPKTFVDEEAKRMANRKGIKSFLSKQVSDTSLFQEDTDAVDTTLPNGSVNAVGVSSEDEGEGTHLLTLKDYEDFISHPRRRNGTLLSGEEDSIDDSLLVPESEMTQTGETRSMDNIVEGDDDDEVIAEATSLREQSLAKSALHLETGEKRKNVLREQESLRKLEHDKLIERYSRPPSDPLDYLAHVFEELDSDTKAAEETNNKKETSTSKKNNVVVDSLASNKTTQIQESAVDANITNNNTSSLNFNVTDPSNVMRNNQSSKEDATLLNSVFKTINSANITSENGTSFNNKKTTLNSSETHATSLNNTVVSVKVKRIVDADLEPWTNSHVQRTIESPVKTSAFQQLDVGVSEASLTERKYPLGDIAEVALLVNKRNRIPKTVMSSSSILSSPSLFSRERITSTSTASRDGSLPSILPLDGGSMSSIPSLGDASLKDNSIQSTSSHSQTIDNINNINGNVKGVRRSVLTLTSHDQENVENHDMGDGFL